MQMNGRVSEKWAVTANPMDAGSVLSRNGEKAIHAEAQGRESKVKLERSVARSCTAMSVGLQSWPVS